MRKVYNETNLKNRSHLIPKQENQMEIIIPANFIPTFRKEM
jgi:hypothetical protein